MLENQLYLPPAEATSRDCLECPPPETCRQTPRIAQPQRLPQTTPCMECPTPETSGRLPGVPNPRDYRETPETTVRLRGVPNPRDYHETVTPWSAQPQRLPRDSLDCPTPETTARLPGLPNPRNYCEICLECPTPKTRDSLECPTRAFQDLNANQWCAPMDRRLSV